MSRSPTNPAATASTKPARSGRPSAESKRASEAHPRPGRQHAPHHVQQDLRDDDAVPPSLRVLEAQQREGAVGREAPEQAAEHREAPEGMREAHRQESDREAAD